MIGYYINNKGIFTSEGDAVTKPPYLDWLVEHYADDIKIFYDLDASVSSLVKLIEVDEENATQLWQKERLNIPPYRLKYFPARFFSIDKGHGETHPYANFANGRRYKSDVHYSLDESIDDWIAKAKMAKAMGEQASSILQGLNVDKDRVTSPVAAVIDKYVNSLRLTTVDDIPEEAGELAYACIKGNWLEAWSLGYWQHCYDYDINGAYGSELAKLLDLRRGTWLRSPEMPKEAVYGFCEGSITTRAEFHPYLLKVGSDYAYTPIGTWQDCFTLADLKLMADYDLAKVDIKRGWWWIPKGQPYTPLKGLVKVLWEKRMASDGLEKDIIRQILAGIWGRFSQVIRGRFGEQFNPVYAAIVENNTRVNVARTCLDAGIIPLHVAVDGVITDKPLFPNEGTRELGGWRLSHEGKCIIVSSGIVGFEGKKGAEEFSLHYDWLYNQLKDKPRETSYAMSKWSPVTMGRALQGEYGRLGELEETERSVIVGRDYKRAWQRLPQCGGDLLNNRYNSAPIDAHLAGAKIDEGELQNDTMP